MKRIGSLCPPETKSFEWIKSMSSVAHGLPGPHVTAIASRTDLASSSSAPQVVEWKVASPSEDDICITRRVSLAGNRLCVLYRGFDAKVVSVVDAHAQASLAQYPVPGEPLRLCMAPKGDRFMIAGNRSNGAGYVRGYSTETGAKLWGKCYDTAEPGYRRRSYVFDMALSADGNSVVSVAQRSFHGRKTTDFIVSSTDSGKKQHRWIVPAETYYRIGAGGAYLAQEDTLAATSVAMGRRYVAVGSEHRRVYTWDLRHTKEPAMRLSAPEEVSSVAIAVNAQGDDQFVLGSGTLGDIYVWALRDHKGGEEHEPTAIMKGHTEQISRLFCSDLPNRAVSGAGDKTARCWDLESFQELEPSRRQHSSCVADVCMTPQGEWVSFDHRSSVQLGPLESQESKTHRAALP